MSYIQRILSLPTRRLLAVYQSYRFSSDLDWFINSMKAELDKREHVPRRGKRKCTFGKRKRHKYQATPAKLS